MSKTQPEAATAQALWARASHSLRQPMQAALYLTHAVRAGTSEPGLTPSLDALEAALQGLQQQIDLLIELSRLEPVATQPVSLAEAGAAALQAALPVAAARRVGLRFAVPTAGAVESQRRLLQLLLTGMLLNAVRLGTGARVVAGGRRRAGKQRIEVWFRGPPVSAAQAEGAFIDLVTVTADRPTANLALGLGFIAHVAAQLGHDFAIASPAPALQCFSLEMSPA
jgi:signal transduction histidine kinase